MKIRFTILILLTTFVLLSDPTYGQIPIKDAIKTTRESVVQVICSDIDSKGSGFVVHKDGYILTNNHVVAKYTFQDTQPQVSYSQNIKVKFDDGREFSAKVAFSKNLTEDLRPLLYDYAILKIDGQSHKPVMFSNYNDAVEGANVFFCGFPLSSEHITTHMGMVSAKYTREGYFNRIPQKVIQIDGSINRGNSGGPLFDANTGKVIGIISTREGGISKELDQLRQYILNQKKQGSGGVYILGVDPLPVIVELINTLDNYISVGIGHAISIEYASVHLKELVK